MNGSSRREATTIASLACALSAAVALVGEAPAQSAQGQYKLGTAKDVDIRVTGLFQELPQSGHYPLRFSIQNRSALKFEGRVRVDASSGYYRYESEFVSEFEISAEPGTEAVFSLIAPLPPPHPSRHSTPSLRWKLTHNMPGSSPERSVGGNIDSNHPAVAYGTEAGTLIQRRIGGRMQRSGHSSGGSNGTQFDTRDLPADPLALSGMDMVVLTGSDWSDVPEASRAALLDWVRLGGALVLYPQGAGRTFSQMGVDVAGPPEGEKCSRLGMGMVTMARPFDPDRGNTIDTETPVEVMRNHPTRYERFTNHYTHSWPAGAKLGERKFATAQVVIILFLFGILVGPVNLFVWAKPGRRHRLFFTTPLISLVASLLLAGLIAVQDGFGGKGVRHTLVLTDPDTNKAYVMQEQASRTGVLLGGSFGRENGGLAVQLPWGSSGASGAGADRRSFRQSGDTLSGDWFRSRSDQAQYMEAAVPSRGGIEISTGGGEPKLVSSFDFPLGEVVYVDRDGSYWRADRADTGAEMAMRPMSREDFAAWCIDCSRQFSAALKEQVSLDSLIHRRGMYFATSSEPDGLAIESLGSVRWRDSFTFLHGRVTDR